jgi:glycosyltransferase involved in cell wall biosynthesis
LIGETLRSLLSQSLPADEIIVVDDGSTDNTVQVAESFGAPVKVILRKNGGPAAARNTGLAAAKGEFIHFFDSDDLAAENKHELQLKALELSGADIAIGPWIQGRFLDRQFQSDNLALQQRGLPITGSLEKALLTSWSIVPHAMFFRRSIVEKAGGFDESLFVGEDQKMFLSCLLHGARVTPTPDTIMFYRVGDAGKITENKQWSAKRLSEWARFLLKARELCLQKGIEPLKWFGFRRRVWEALQDLTGTGSTEGELILKLKNCLGNGTPDSIYQCHRQLERWRGGLQQRFSGGRAHRFFRIGSLTKIQIGLLNKLGYDYRPPQRLPWRPKSNKPSNALADY